MGFSVIQPLIQPQQQQERPGFGSSFGQALGQSLLSSAQEQVQQGAVNRALGQLKPGMSPEQIMQIGAQLPRDQQEMFLKGYVPMVQKQQEQKAAEEAAKQKERRDQQTGSVLDNYIMSNFAKKIGYDASQESPEALQTKKAGEVGEIVGKRRKLENLKDMLEKAPLDQKIKILDQIRKEDEKEAKKGEAIFRRHEKFIEKIQDKRDEGQKEVEKLENERELIQSPNINSPWQISNAYRIGRPDLLHEDTILAQKSFQERMFKAGQDFGSARPTDFLLKSYEKAIPTIMLSKPALEALFDARQQQATANQAEAIAYDEIMEGREYPPENLRSLVNKRSIEIRKDSAKKFNEYMKKAKALGQEEEDRIEAARKEQGFGYAENYKLGRGELSLGKPEDKAPLAEPKKKVSEQPKSPTLKEKFTPGGKEELGTARAIRDVARTAVRIPETLAAMPGNTAELAKIGLMKAAGSKLTPADRDKIGIMHGVEGVKNAAKAAVEDAYDAFRSVFKTSGELSDITSKITGGYTEPKSELEKSGDAITSTVTALGSFGMDLSKAAGAALAGEGGYYGSKLFTDDPTKQELARAGVTFVASVINPNSAKNLFKNLYASMESSIPAEAEAFAIGGKGKDFGKKVVMETPGKVAQSAISPQKTIVKLADAEHNILRGGIKPKSSGPALKHINEFKDTLKGTNLQARDITAANRSINETLASIWEDAELGFKEKPIAKAKLLEVKEVVNQAAEEYGKKNPEFLEKYRAANAAYESYAASKKMSNSIVRAAEKVGGWVKLDKLFKSGGGLVTKGLMPVETFYKYSWDPSWRKYYSQVMKSALEQNIPATTNSLVKANKRAKELDKKLNNEKKLYEKKKQLREETLKR